MRKLELTNGSFTLVDNEDYKTYSAYTSFLSKDGYAYVIIKEGNKMRNRLLSRLIMEAQKGKFVDHINRDKLDNQRSNLRLCSPRESSMNRGCHIDCKSGYKGVSLNNIKYKNKPWRARIFDKKEINIGSFATKEEAALAYNEVAIKLYGEFASLNKIYA